MYKIVQFIQHSLRAKTKHGVHSPFVFDFVTNVVPRQVSESGKKIEAIRKRLLNNKNVIEIEDFGAGYGGDAHPVIRKSIRQVVQSSARRQGEGEFLQRMVARYAPRQVLELGTNLGFSTMYLGSNLSHQHQLISIEGSKELSKLAAANLALMQMHPTLLVGEFSAVFQQQINWETFRPDMVLFDGNHREEATLAYFEFLLPRLGEQAVLILDDIYWNKGMTNAWETITRHPRVTVSLDLFHLGICFLDRNQAKEHFRLKSWSL